VSAKRYHHQYLPDEVQFELGGLSAEAQRDLNRRGHQLKENSRNYGNMHAILWNRATDEVDAASDPRGEGAASVFAVPME
jgi:gamma-glutamyltranspeptidase/glutathione hydrolase